MFKRNSKNSWRNSKNANKQLNEMRKTKDNMKKITPQIYKNHEKNWASGDEKLNNSSKISVKSLTIDWIKLKIEYQDFKT
jgi:hypothetical protein